MEVPQQQTKKTNNIKHFKILQFMKNGITLLFALTIIGGVFAYYNKQTENLSEDKFLERDTYLNKRIDSLKAMVLDLAKNQDTIKNDLDTLKGGQKIIFDEVKKSANTNFWNLF